VKLPESLYAGLPPHLQELFKRLPNPGKAEVLAGFPESVSTGGSGEVSKNWRGDGHTVGASLAGATGGFGDIGSAARYFYTAKADSDDRLGSKHPTVKPVDLMAYLCRLVCPPGGIILDPFAGSGTTGMACMREGFNAVLIEREAAYVADIKRRLAHVKGEDAPLFAKEALEPEPVT
jgi:DNA modification methylase